MFKFKYNLLALSQVMISFLNYFLLMKVFGVSDATDAYLITSAVFGSLILLQMLTTEQFLFFYNDIKAKNFKDAYNFYGVALTVSALTAVVTFIIAYFGSSFIIDFFINSTEDTRSLLINSFFHIAILELLVSPIQSINQRLMNAEMYFTVPYLLNIIPILFVLITMVYIYYATTDDISLLIYAKVLGSFVTLFISFFVVRSMNIPIKISLRHSQLKGFIHNSFTMRFGHNIHNFLFTPITTNILTSLPSGYASYFYYAMKIATIINSIVVGPSSKVFQSKFSSEWSNKHINIAKSLIFKYMKITVPLIIVSSIVVYFILPNVLHLIANKLTLESLDIIQSIFVGLMIWQLIILIESGSVFILVVEKKSQMFIYTNLIFTLMYFGFANLFLKEFSIYAIIYSLILAQLVNFAIYTYYGQKIMKQRSKQYEA